MVSMRGIRSLATVGKNLGNSELQDRLEDEKDRGWGMVDFSSNRIDVTGVRYFVRFALECKALQIVKLHKNALGDEGAAALAPLVEQPVLRELHLSHNGIGAKGCAALLDAAGKGLSDRKELLFIRLEQNRIASPADVVLRELRKSEFCCRYDSKCTRAGCSRGRLLHLPLIWKQETGVSQRDKEELDGRSPSPPSRPHAGPAVRSRSRRRISPRRRPVCGRRGRSPPGSSRSRSRRAPRSRERRRSVSRRRRSRSSSRASSRSRAR